VNCRASIDFFEHQQDKTVARYVSGASAASEFIVQTLQNRIDGRVQDVESPEFLQIALPPQQAGEIEHVAAATLGGDRRGAGRFLVMP